MFQPGRTSSSQFATPSGPRPFQDTSTAGNRISTGMWHVFAWCGAMLTVYDDLVLDAAFQESVVTG